MSRIKIISFTLLLFLNQPFYGQNLTDSIQKLNEVIVKAYFTPQALLRSPSSAIVMDDRQIRQNTVTSLIPVMNTVPGVRMEERSPGSYRLSIRGSLLRSPFGVRNVKVYLDEFPLTDASGFTYLNILDMNDIRGIEILKGPDGSLFGANSGGVVIIKLFENNANELKNSIDASGGSFGLFHENITLRSSGKNSQFKLSQGYQKSDGYRANSSMNRNFLKVEETWNYTPGNEFRILMMYSDYGYLTPGGLTLQQMENNPKSARPGTPFVPGAIEQHASVRNKVFTGGIVHKAKLTEQLKQVTSVFGSYVDFGNIAIANIEDKIEKSIGFRTYIELSGRKGTPVNWQWDAGLEYQQTHAEIRNFGNNGGLHDTLQAENRLNVQQNFFFTRFYTDIYKRLIIEGAISINSNKYRFGPLYSESALVLRKFDPQFMPKLAVSLKFTENIVGRASVSRGFSPPTIDEIRSSDNIVNTDLQPENGWNYETGLRFRQKKDRYWLDALVFNYNLQDAIVRRVNPDNTEYFVNVGGTRQVGFETSLSAWIIEPRKKGFIRELQLRNSYTVSNFNFRNYIKGSEDYSGNSLTGVPEEVIITSLSMAFPKNIYFFGQHNYTSRIPLNDANSVFSKYYNLVQVKAGWRIVTPENYNLEIYAAVDNLLNERYSLGNDLNAMGERYFNPSPVRNYLAGIKLSF